jgi:uncharacterized protein DUF6304
MRIPLEYRDGGRSTSGELRSDGNWLHAEIDGVRFDGMSLDSLVPRPSGQTGVSRFNTGGGCLCDCQLIAEFPARVLSDQEEVHATLTAVVTIGSYDPKTWEDPEWAVALGITLGGVDYETGAETDSFEAELIALQGMLPDRYRLTNCFFCAFSDYNLGFHESYGALACFRDVRDEYLRVQSEDDLTSLWDRQSEVVQETYLCNAFKLRSGGHGCRSLLEPRNPDR